MDAGTTLRLAIPPLETLHRAWSSCSEQSKYSRFAPALSAAAQKLDEYYERTTDSPAYIMAMRACLLLHILPLLTFHYTNPVLDPMAKKHWSEDLQDDVLACVENIVRVI